MRNYKFNELEEGKLYSNVEGYYIYKGGAVFEEVEFDEEDNYTVIATHIKKENELKFY